MNFKDLSQWGYWVNWTSKYRNIFEIQIHWIIFLGECTFENGFCTWYNIPNSQGDDFDWLRGSGSTQSSYTGPSADRFGSKTGMYLSLAGADLEADNNTKVIIFYYSKNSILFPLAALQDLCRKDGTTIRRRANKELFKGRSVSTKNSICNFTDSCKVNNDPLALNPVLEYLSSLKYFQYDFLFLQSILRS